MTDFVSEISIKALSGGQSSKVTLSTTSAQSAVVAAGTTVLITLDVAGFVRFGANPTALADGTDQYLLANVTYRIDMSGTGLSTGKFAFILASGTGNAYITPGA